MKSHDDHKTMNSKLCNYTHMDELVDVKCQEGEFHDIPDDDSNSYLP